jgi:hypothetical protein
MTKYSPEALKIAETIRQEIVRMSSPDYPFPTSISAEYRGRMLHALYLAITDRKGLVKSTPAAAALIHEHGWKDAAKHGLRWEHITPNQVMIKVIRESESAEHLIDCCRSCWRHGEHVAITRDEDRLLRGGSRKTSLAHNMPAGWVPSDDPIVRYEQAGIEQLVEWCVTG